jgi:hypothetical protein
LYNDDITLQQEAVVLSHGDTLAIGNRGQSSTEPHAL